MGVHQLWKILEPTADPVKLESLRGKTLAIDASIWIYHFLKAMRDPKGTVLAAAHIIGFFRRICKLMFFEIKPVFVFDGAPPILKKQVTNKRSERRVGREQSARATANKLSTIQLQRAAAQKKESQYPESNDQGGITKVKGSIPKDAVYYEDLVSASKPDGTAQASSSSAPIKSKPFIPMDQYHLPDVEKIGPIRANDQRMLTEEELEDYAKQFTDQARMGFIDTSLVDFQSKEFEQSPIETQYQLSNMARMKSRLRMGYTADQLNEMFPDQMEFSKFQINRVAQRNYFTQRLISLVGMEEDSTRRVSSEKNKEYFLKKTDQGWSSSLEEHQGRNSSQEPQIAPQRIKTEEKGTLHPRLSGMKKADQQGYAESESESDDAEFEDVDIEAEPEMKPEEVQQALSKEDSNMIDELFGYEAKLTREQLYDKLLYNMESEDEEERPPPPSRGGAARSMLFGKSAKQIANEDYASTPMKSSEVPQAKPEHKEATSTGEPEKGVTARKTPTPPPAVPWFEEQGNFEEMRIAEKYDKNFVPLDYVFEEEDGFEEVDIAPSIKDVSSQGRVSEVSPSAAKSLEDAHAPEAVPKKEQKNIVAEAKTPHHQTGEAERVQDTVEVSRPSSTEPAEMSEHVVKIIGAPQEVPKETQTELFEQSESEDEEHEAEPLSSEVTLPTTDTRAPIISPSSEQVELTSKSSEMIPKTIPEETQEEMPEATAETEPGEPQIQSSPEAIERANEEAREADEENEDIAGMLIAEAEENERFARELAAQNNQGWSQANEREYQTQISQLRNQFAQESRDADNVSTEMIQECQELLQLFGIPYITAPAEAEAQCAELHSSRLVDGVVTDDGDTFLFDNDARVYRNMFSQAKFVEFYSTKRIENRLGLNRERMIDLAFLLGSDYTEGILGIGPVTSVEISAEFGDSRHFAEWWSEAQRFPDTADVGTPLKRRLLKNFQTKMYLPEDFPNPAIVDAYLHPAVDNDSTKFTWGTPDLDRLREFMETTAGWEAAKTDSTLLPVVQEQKRRDLLEKTEKAMNQSRLDDYYRTVVQNPEMGSKRAAKAAGTMRKRQRK